MLNALIAAGCLVVMAVLLVVLDCRSRIKDFRVTGLCPKCGGGRVLDVGAGAAPKAWIIRVMGLWTFTCQCGSVTEIDQDAIRMNGVVVARAVLKDGAGEFVMLPTNTRGGE